MWFYPLVPGYLKGYVRRFAQKSPDHRGTEESPGRVVTLVHQEEWHEFSPSDSFPDTDVVWGVAFTINPAYAAEVRDLLDLREIAGYTLEEINVYGVGPDGGEVVVVQRAQVYVARKDNPAFVANESLEEIAGVIWRSVGPSGTNEEYLYNLGSAIRDLAPESEDSHLVALESLCRKWDQELVGSGRKGEE
ncbi:ChaC-like protein [Thelephora terrestris]|uniref:glutathione-specific gamma-glutamylcyclotransferase n=1 Tax=Thelephora terrestris TaxID=56493 RepID=A0A9P6L2H6_9AGAM|nr:ChaC-like protein [Thelephora terrestris]